MSHLPKERNPLVTILIGLAIIGGGWFAYASTQQAPVVKPEPVPTVVETDRSEKIRAEIRDQIAKNAKLEQPEPSNELPEPSEEEWIPVIPAEVLAQQGGNAAAVPTTPSNAQSPEGLASEGRQKAATGDWNGAAEAFQKAVDAAPNQIGYQEDLVKRFTERVKVLKPNLFYSVLLNSGSVKANKWLGYISRDEGDIAGSNQYFSKIFGQQSTRSESDRAGHARWIALLSTFRPECGLSFDFEPPAALLQIPGSIMNFRCSNCDHRSNHALNVDEAEALEALVSKVQPIFD